MLAFVREVAEFLPEWEYVTPEYGHLARLTWTSEFEGYTPVISARVDGGRVVFAGTPAQLVAARGTLTGEHLARYVGG